MTIKKCNFLTRKYLRGSKNRKYNTKHTVCQERRHRHLHIFRQKSVVILLFSIKK